MRLLPQPRSPCRASTFSSTSLGMRLRRDAALFQKLPKCPKTGSGAGHHLLVHLPDRIATPTDFLGGNYYTRLVMRAPEAKLPQEVAPQGERTAMGWEVHPEGLYEILGRLHFCYRFPSYFVTENGAAYQDDLEPDGSVRDEKRIAYLRGHIIQVHKALSAEIPVRGYFVWSLLDNFEWAYGYGKRFGLVYVDHKTLKRIPKASAHWYTRVIATGTL